MKTHFFPKTVYTLVLLFSILGLQAHANKPPKPKHYATRSKAVMLARLKIDNVWFGFNKTSIPAKCYPTLNHVAQLMADSSASLKLGGYADNKGGYVYNWKLSKVRADAVKAYLVSKGADASKIASTEYGYTHPIASNNTPAGRQKNRRVEIHFAN
jgi:OOP family OmpA-OmpF porin